MQQRTEAHLVTLNGEIDVDSVLAVPPGDRRVVVDTSGVTFAGSALLSWLIRTKDECNGLVLVRPSPAVVRLLTVAGVTDEFSVEP